MPKTIWRVAARHDCAGVDSKVVVIDFDLLIIRTVIKKVSCAVHIVDFDNNRCGLMERYYP